MQRRTFIAGAAAAGLAAPHIARAADDRILRFVPQSALSNLDPASTNTQYEQYVIGPNSYSLAGFRFNVDTVFSGLEQVLQPVFNAHPENFGGLSVKETAEVLRVSVETVMRDWKFAKAWLLREVRDQTPRTPLNGKGATP